jgi:serine/threonine/tyrosine protein kinase RAD53
MRHSFLNYAMSIHIFSATSFIECLLAEDPDKRLSLTEALKHPWLSSYTPIYNLHAYDTISSLDPQDFSMLSSMPGFDINASVTTNMNGLKLNSAPGPPNRLLRGKSSIQSCIVGSHHLV